MNARPVPPAVALAVVAAIAMHGLLGWLSLGDPAGEGGPVRTARPVTVRLLEPSRAVPRADFDRPAAESGMGVAPSPELAPALPLTRDARQHAAESRQAARAGSGAVPAVAGSNGPAGQRGLGGRPTAADEAVAPAPTSRSRAEDTAGAPGEESALPARGGPASIAAPPDADAERRAPAAALAAGQAALLAAAGAGQSPIATEQSPPPLYATRVPPAATLHYALRRGAAQGTATLTWQPPDAAGHYRLVLEGRAGGSRVLLITSDGSVDESGLAPIRFVERHPRGGARAANFEREHGIVSFSGPSVVHPLHAAMQDPLSWMVQLAAIVAADPQRAQPGAVTRLLVAGTRGDVDHWDFVATAPGEADATAAASTHGLLRWLREPRRRYDLRAEVWLDPARDHLPVGLRLGTWSADNVLELLLDEPAAAPR